MGSEDDPPHAHPSIGAHSDVAIALGTLVPGPRSRPPERCSLPPCPLCFENSGRPARPDVERTPPREMARGDRMGARHACTTDDEYGDADGGGRRRSPAAPQPKNTPGTAVFAPSDGVSASGSMAEYDVEQRHLRRVRHACNGRELGAEPHRTRRRHRGVCRARSARRVQPDWTASDSLSLDEFNFRVKPLVKVGNDYDDRPGGLTGMPCPSSSDALVNYGFGPVTTRGDASGPECQSPIPCRRRDSRAHVHHDLGRDRGRPRGAD